MGDTRQFNCPSIEICAVGAQEASNSNPRPGSSEEDERESEVLSPGHSQRLLIRNTFLAVPERSPSVERCLERQCKSCPVSAPQSAVGSARIEHFANKPSGLDFAVV